jgi:hypothetical protein
MKSNSKFIRMHYYGTCSNQMHKLLTEQRVFQDEEKDRKFALKRVYKIDPIKQILEFHIDDVYRVDLCLRQLKLKARRL